MSTTKPVIPNSTITRDVRELDKTTDNIYESIVIISKRANQIANNLKEELHGKLADFASSKDLLIIYGTIPSLSSRLLLLDLPK